VGVPCDSKLPSVTSRIKMLDTVVTVSGEVTLLTQLVSVGLLLVGVGGGDVAMP